MRRRFSERQHLHTVSELNVTPLLDLAFVLLIIFMITTPLMENATDLTLPSSDDKQPAEANVAGTINVSIHSDKRITVDDRAFTREELEAHLAQLAAAKPDTAVIIRPHKELNVQEFTDVLVLVKRAGVKKTGIGTVPRD